MLSDPSMDGEIQSISDGIVEGNPGSRERVAILKPKPEDHDDKARSNLRRRVKPYHCQGSINS